MIAYGSASAENVNLPAEARYTIQAQAAIGQIRSGNGGDSVWIFARSIHDKFIVDRRVIAFVKGDLPRPWDEIALLLKMDEGDRFYPARVFAFLSPFVEALQQTGCHFQEPHPLRLPESETLALRFCHAVLGEAELCGP